MLSPNPESEARKGLGKVFMGTQSAVQRKPSILSTTLYLLGILLVFALLGWAAAQSTLAYTTYRVLAAALFLVLGWAHLALAERLLSWYNAEDAAHRFWLTLAAWVAGNAGLVLLLWVPWTKVEHALALLPSTAFFPVPYFFREAFAAWTQIPAEVYKKWYFRADAPGPDLSRMNLNNFMVIHFWMPRRFGESLYHDFTSKAPHEMRLGDLFQIFLDDYNRSKPDQAIQYVDEHGQAYGWVFYAKSAWWSRRRYYDPDYTFQDNFLRQGDIIVAKRIVS